MLTGSNIESHHERNKHDTEAVKMATLTEDHHRVATRILFCPSEERTQKELRNLAPSERKQVWADMAGNRENIEYRVNAETPELLHQQLIALDHEMSLIEPGKKAAYTHAMQCNPDYVLSERLKFLRADDFDASLAAVRMANHFECKLELFGADRLGRGILLSDLSEDDMESLRGGGIQLLPMLDHASRAVVFTSARNYTYKRRENMLRAFYYVSQYAASVEHIQKVGIVSVSYQVGEYKTGYDYELTRQVSALVRCMPCRFVSIYLCYSATPWQRVADLVSHLVSPILRVRLRSVQGSHQECLYKLMSLGIPSQAIPVNEHGQSLLSNQHRWIEEQRQKKENNRKVEG